MRTIDLGYAREKKVNEKKTKKWTNKRTFAAVQKIKKYLANKNPKLYA